MIAAPHYRGRGSYRPRKQEDEHIINERIRASEVRVVGDGIESKVYTLNQALQIADEMDLDLVLISPKANPPVCRVVDYKKFLYQQKKKEKELKAKQIKVVVKEIRFGPNTDDHDIQFKLKHAKNFLEEGAKVKAYVFFKGRSIIYKEKGGELLREFAKNLEEYGELEGAPMLTGKRMTIFILPHKKK